MDHDPPDDGGGPVLPMLTHSPGSVRLAPGAVARLLIEYIPSVDRCGHVVLIDMRQSRLRLVVLAQC